MDLFQGTIDYFSEQYFKLKTNSSYAEKYKMPGDVYAIGDYIISIPRDDGDSRYPYGKGGFNFWAYTSGYMHCNEGLFSPFLKANEGKEPKIAFFAGFPDESENYQVISLLPVPFIENNSGKKVERYTVFTRSCTYYITETEDMRFAVRVFVDEANRMFFSVLIRNSTAQNRQLFVSAYLNPFLSHNINENDENKWFREIRYIEDCNEYEKDGYEKDRLGSFIIKVNEDLDRTTSVSNIGVVLRNIQPDQNSRLTRHQETTSRYQYVGGSRSSLHTPVALKSGSFGTPRHICTFTETGIIGDILHLDTGRHGQVRYELSLDFLKHCSDNTGAAELLEKRITGEKLDTKIEQSEMQEKENGGLLSCRVGETVEGPVKDTVFNTFFEHLKKQVEFCSLIKGYVQLFEGSLIGIRDIFQAIEGLIFWNPAAAREKMLEALGFISPDGRCPRQYTLPVREGTAPKMDLRPFIDQGVWVISTVTTYLKFTNDFEFLNEKCGYYEIVDEKKSLVKKSSIQDSVLEHLLKIMNYLLSNRDFEGTGCIRALYGDWNDALDGLGVSSDPEKEYGTGVSVMASLQVYQNLQEMLEMLDKIDSSRYSSQITSYKASLRALENVLHKYAIVTADNGEKRIVHGWGDKRSYIVGGFNDPDGKSRVGLTSNAFWILSKMYELDPGIKDTILDAFNKLDSKYGYKTFDPFFGSDAQGVGRIKKLPPGTAENGAAYIHASAFAVMALFRIGCSGEAWQQLFKLLPFTHEKISCSPFVMPNSYGYNAEKQIDGQSMQDWQTGSSNVVLKTLIKYVFGLEPQFGGVWIQPAKCLPFEEFNFQITVKGCRVNILYRNSGSGNRKYAVNGNNREGIHDEIMMLKKLWISDAELETKSLKIYVED